LRYRVAFEIVAEITFAHHGLLASNLAKKVSTNLGAIHWYLDVLKSNLNIEGLLPKDVAVDARISFDTTCG